MDDLEQSDSIGTPHTKEAEVAENLKDSDSAWNADGDDWYYRCWKLDPPMELWGPICALPSSCSSEPSLGDSHEVLVAKLYKFRKDTAPHYESLGGLGFKYGLLTSLLLMESYSRMTHELEPLMLRTPLPITFQKAIKEYIPFYIRHIAVYAYLRDAVFREDFNSNSLDLIRVPVELFADRHKAGLLRDTQIQLLGAVYRGTMEEVHRIIERNGEMKEINDALDRSYPLVKRLIASGRFRSERLELLILKYLKEEGVCMDVVRGVNKASEEIEARTSSIWNDGNLMVLGWQKCTEFAWLERYFP
ncbi:hypothetical protein BJ508DRAFT_417433 [Ascobolus immersus RN42]|uniref:Uncharacterized protein n=1 Tax=Ascobolus immersus RN42 TaxID=1160509 RepID=A0A3N4HWG4_ASCIM|nr:hypothetical protein BJ508DRAFT_417433 [Ascobolus immersus RN42]